MLSVVTVLAKPRPRGGPPAETRAVSHLTCFACTLSLRHRDTEDTWRTSVLLPPGVSPGGDERAGGDRIP